MITFLGLSPSLDLTYLVDDVRVGAIHRPRRVLALPGGKSLNAARAAATQKADVTAIAPLGGANGERMTRELQSDGVHVVVVPRAGETRQCVTVFGDNETVDPTEFYEPPIALDDAAWREIVGALRGVAVGWLAVSGSVPATHASDLAELLADASRRGIRIAVDTHGDALAAILERVRPDLVKVNRGEAAELLGAGSAASLAGRLQRRGARLAIVTDGADGAVAADGAAVLRAAPPVHGRYAVGSGDCFLAGALVALDRSGSTRDALTLATALAAANTLQPGAALFDVDDARRLRETVAVTEDPADAA